MKGLSLIFPQGGAAGATSLLFVYSLDYARTRLANDNKSASKGGSRQFNGLVDVYKKTLASDGIAGLYRGFVPSVVGIIVYRGLYFGLYDSVKPVILVGPLEGNFLASFALGWGVTTGAGLASYPLDTIRRRMMMTSGGGVHYKSMMDAGSQIVAKEGIRSLFKGAGANILRGVAGAGVLSLYDKLQELMFGKVYSVSRVLLLRQVLRIELTWLGWLWVNARASCSRPLTNRFASRIKIPTFIQSSILPLSLPLPPEKSPHPVYSLSIHFPSFFSSPYRRHQSLLNLHGSVWMWLRMVSEMQLWSHEHASAPRALALSFLPTETVHLRAFRDQCTRIDQGEHVNRLGLSIARLGPGGGVSRESSQTRDFALQCCRSFSILFIPFTLWV